MNMLDFGEICVGLITSGTNRYKERPKKILESWGKVLEHVYFFTDSEVDDSKFLMVSRNSSFSSNKEKMINGIVEIYNMNLDCKYYLMGDDDNYFFIKNILKFANESISEEELSFYGRDIYNRKGLYWNNYRAVNHAMFHPTRSAGDTLDYCGGGGVLFNKKSFKKMAEYIKNNYDKVMIKFPKYADASIGYICKYSGMKMVGDDRFHTDCYMEFNNEEDYLSEKIKSYLENQFSFHKVIEDEHYSFLNKYA